MSGRGRDLPPDMRLLQARAAVLRPKRARETIDLEILAPDEDALVDSDSPEADEQDSLLLSRPIADVHLGHIGWSGAIDHGALQAALACAPVTPSPVPAWLALAGLDQPLNARVLADAGRDASALEVGLSSADLGLCEELASAADGAAFRAMACALVLPEKIVGASAPTRAALAEVFAAYRRASLAHAWGARLDLMGREVFAQERDESAVALLSTLRAVLGER